MSAPQGGIEVADHALFARIAAGDAAAFAEFYDRHAARWYGLALRMTQNPAEAQDILQDAAVLVWERAPLFDPNQGHPAAWALTVVRNRTLDRLRAGRRRGDALDRLARSADSPAASTAADLPMPDLPSDDASSLIRQTLLALPADQRRAIELAFFGGLSQSEVADALGQPLGTIKARIRRGMLAMRDALEGVL